MTVIAANTVNDTYEVIGDPIVVGNYPISVAVVPEGPAAGTVYVTNDNPYDSDNTVNVITIVPMP
jgi:hypothetical protein